MATTPEETAVAVSNEGATEEANSGSNNNGGSSGDETPMISNGTNVPVKAKIPAMLNAASPASVVTPPTSPPSSFRSLLYQLADDETPVDQLSECTDRVFWMIKREDTGAREELVDVGLDLAHRCQANESFSRVLVVLAHAIHVQCATAPKKSEGGEGGDDTRKGASDTMLIRLLETSCHLILRRVFVDPDNEGRDLLTDFATSASLAFLDKAAAVFAREFSEDSNLDLQVKTRDIRPQSPAKAVATLLKGLAQLFKGRVHGLMKAEPGADEPNDMRRYYFAPALCLYHDFVVRQQEEDIGDYRTGRKTVVTALAARLLSPAVSEVNAKRKSTAAPFEVQLCSPVLSDLTQAEFDTVLGPKLKFKLLSDAHTTTVTVFAMVRVFIDAVPGSAAGCIPLDLTGHLDSGCRILPAALKQLISPEPRDRGLGSDLLVSLLIAISTTCYCDNNVGGDQPSGSNDSGVPLALFRSVRLMATSLLQYIQNQAVAPGGGVVQITTPSQMEALILTVGEVGKTYLDLLQVDSVTPPPHPHHGEGKVDMEEEQKLANHVLEAVYDVCRTSDLFQQASTPEQQRGVVKVRKASDYTLEMWEVVCRSAGGNPPIYEEHHDWASGSTSMGKGEDTVEDAEEPEPPFQLKDLATVSEFSSSNPQMGATHQVSGRSVMSSTSTLSNLEPDAWAKARVRDETRSLYPGAISRPGSQSKLERTTSGRSQGDENNTLSATGRENSGDLSEYSQNSRPQVRIRDAPGRSPSENSSESRPGLKAKYNSFSSEQTERTKNIPQVRIRDAPGRSPSENSSESRPGLKENYNSFSSEQTEQTKNITAHGSSGHAGVPVGTYFPEGDGDASTIPMTDSVGSTPHSRPLFDDVLHRAPSTTMIASRGIEGQGPGDPVLMEEAGGEEALPTAVAVAQEDLEDEVFIESAEEFDPSTNKFKVCRDKRFIAVSICCVVLMAAIAITVSLTVTNKVVSDAEEEYENFCITDDEGYFEAVLTISEREDLCTDHTPQFYAYHWIRLMDKKAVQPNDPFFLQRYVLATFYFATKGYNWATCGGRGDTPTCEYRCFGDRCPPNATCEGANCVAKTSRYLSETDECDWMGSFCDDEGNIQQIEILQNNLHGVLPNELSTLTHLRRLGVAANFIGGTIPQGAGNWTRMMELNLKFNGFTGSIPDSLYELKALRNLDIGSNLLTGTVSSKVSQLENLEGLRMYNNSLGGSLPAEVGSIATLGYINVRQNQLSGSIPQALGQLSEMKEIHLDFNLFNGAIPPQLGSLGKLEILQLNNNRLSEGLPEELFNLRALTYLYLFDNKFTGTLSSRIGELTNLSRLIIEGNSFTGAIPPELSQLTNLEFLWLHYNEFKGSMPESICELRQSDGSPESLYADCLGGTVDCPAECCTDCCNNDMQQCFPTS